MGYEFHLTRKPHYLDEEGEEISLLEWENYIAQDKEMRLDGYAEAKTPDGILRTEAEGLAVWVAWSKHEEQGGKAWLQHFEGNISCKIPDKEVLGKMFRIAQALNATLQGDDGEIIDSSTDIDSITQAFDTPEVRKRIARFHRKKLILRVGEIALIGVVIAAINMLDIW